MASLDWRRASADGGCDDSGKFVTAHINVERDIQDKKCVREIPFSQKSACTDEKRASTRLSRVDRRWAAAKGFLDKDTQEWKEEMGGKEAYIRQRNERILARFVQFGARVEDQNFLNLSVFREKRRRISKDSPKDQDSSNLYRINALAEFDKQGAHPGPTPLPAQLPCFASPDAHQTDHRAPRFDF